MKKSISLLLALLLLFSMSVVARAEGESWTCSNGHENPSDNLFCGKCGEKKPQDIMEAVKKLDAGQLEELKAQIAGLEAEQAAAAEEAAEQAEEEADAAAEDGNA